MFTGFTAPVDQSEQRSVIAGLTRNPGMLWHWIPDRVRDDASLLRDGALLLRDGALLLRKHSINSCA